MSHVKVYGIIVLVALAAITLAAPASAEHTPAVAIEPPFFNPTAGAKTFGVNVSNDGAATADGIWRVKISPPAGYTLAATQPAAPAGWTRSAPSTGARPFILFETATQRDVSSAILAPDGFKIFPIAVSTFSAPLSVNGTAATWDVETQDTNPVPDPENDLEVGQVKTASATSTADTTPPDFRSFTLPTFAKAGAASISFHATEALGANPTVTVLGRAATRTSGPSPYVYGFTVLAGDANAPAAVSVSGVDIAGNAGSAPGGSFTIDTVAPTIWANQTCALAGENGWCRGSVTLSAASSDETSGVPAPTCTLGGAASACARIVDADAPTYSYAATATDAAGNAGTAATTFKIDATAPTASASATCGVALENGWCPGDYTIARSASDAGSGSVVTTCKLDGVALGSCPTTFGTEGAHELEVIATDAAGNPTTIPLTLKVDKNAPTITTSTSCALAGTDGWCRGAVTPVVTATDAGSGPSAPACTLDGAAASCTAAITNQGAHTLAASTQDALGRSASSSTTFKIDSIAPTIGVTTTCTSSGSGDWCLGNVNVVATAADGETPLTPACTLDGATVACSTTVSTDGAHTFAVSATDAAGNPAPATTRTIKIDKGAPTITLASRTPAPNAAGWVTGDITLTFQCTDVASGTTTTITQVVTGEGASLSGAATCSDPSGRASTLTVGDLKIDRTPPVLELATRSPAANADGWNAGDVSLGWVCRDATSGVASAPASRVITATTTVTTTCTDAAGLSHTLTETLRIDSTPPAITITLAPSAPDGLAGWYLRLPTVSIVASDAGSGLVGVEHSLDGATFIAGATPVLREGTYTLLVRATDRAGTQGTQSVTLAVDLSTPTATLPSGTLTSGRETRILFNEPMDASVALPVPAGWTGAWSSDGRAFVLQIPSSASGTVTLSVPASARDAHGAPVAAASSATYTVAAPAPPPSVPASSGGSSSTPPPPATAPRAPPPDVRAEALRSAARVTWAPGTDDGGAALRGYHVFRDGALLATLGLVTEHVDTTVEPGKVYEYAVRAYNDVGAGPFSPAVGVHVPSPQDAPAVTASLDPAPRDDGVYRVFPRLTLASREGATIHVKVDALLAFVYAEPLVLGDGEHVVSFWAKDALGESALGVLTLRVDTSAPAPADDVSDLVEDAPPVEDPAPTPPTGEVVTNDTIGKTSVPTPEDTTPGDEGSVTGGQRLTPGASLAAIVCALAVVALAARRR